MTKKNSYLWIDENVTMRWQSISSSAPDLLHVALEAFRQIIMEDSANIRFIQTHSKRYGCDDNAQPSRHELLLYSPALRTRHSGVVTFSLPGCRLFCRFRFRRT